MAEDTIQHAKDLLKLERRIAREEATLAGLRAFRADLIALLSGDRAAS